MNAQVLAPALVAGMVAGRTASRSRNRPDTRGCGPVAHRLRGAVDVRDVPALVHARSRSTASTPSPPAGSWWVSPRTPRHCPAQARVRRRHRRRDHSHPRLAETGRRSWVHQGQGPGRRSCLRRCRRRGAPTAQGLREEPDTAAATSWPLAATDSESFATTRRIPPWWIELNPPILGM
jgi:hypothetical protein